MNATNIESVRNVVDDWRMESSSPAPLGARLKKLRSDQGLSLSELARRAEMSKSNLSRAEAGLAVPSLQSLRSLARALSIPVNELTGQETSQAFRTRIPVRAASEKDLKEVRATGLAQDLEVFIAYGSVHPLYLVEGDVLLVSRTVKPQKRDFLLLGDPEPLTISRTDTMIFRDTGEEVVYLQQYGGPYGETEEGVVVLGVIVERRRSRSYLRQRWNYQLS